MIAIVLQNLTKTFGATTAVDAVALTVPAGDLFFLLGPSGCGKTTLLRMIAGFITPTSGSVLFDRRDMTHVPPHRRDAGMVFQSYALWPHMTVAANVAFGLDARKIRNPERQRRIDEALALVQMEHLADRKPNQLSGGQQQRVALARALAIRPQCLLLDEPLSNLDAKLRIEMRAEIRRIVKQTGTTAVYVTHDQKEALSMADGIAVLRRKTRADRHAGGTVPPANLPLRRRLHRGIQLPRRCRRIGGRCGGHRCHAGGQTYGPPGRPPLVRRRKVFAAFRPEAVTVARASGGAGGLGSAAAATPANGNALVGRCVATTYLGEMAEHIVELPNAQRIKAFEMNPDPARSAGGQPEPGAPCTLTIPPENLMLVPA